MKYLKLIPYILILFLVCRVVYLDRQNTKLKNQTATLEENLSKQTIIYKDKIIYKERKGDEVTGVNINQETVYIPSEGKVEILTPEEGKDIDLSLYDKLFNNTSEEEGNSKSNVKVKSLQIGDTTTTFADTTSQVEINGITYSTGTVEYSEDGLIEKYKKDLYRHRKMRW